MISIEFPGIKFIALDRTGAASFTAELSDVREFSLLGRRRPAGPIDRVRVGWLKLLIEAERCVQQEKEKDRIVGERRTADNLTRKTKEIGSKNTRL